MTPDSKQVDEGISLAVVLYLCFVIKLCYVHVLMCEY